MIALSLALLLAQGPGFDVSAIQLDDERRLAAVLAGDIDGDGSLDLVVGAAGGGGRSLCVHLRRAGRPAFAATPDRRVDLPGDVVAFAVGDVLPGGGAELVLFAPRVVAAVRWSEAGPAFERLIAADLLWQPAPRDELATWAAGVTDLDGDGAADLLVPERGGFRIGMQRRGADGEGTFEPTVRLEVPRLPPTREKLAQNRFQRQQGAAALTLLDGRRAPTPLLSVQDSLPAPTCVDWDGDGDLDLLALQDETLHLWRQGADGWPVAPTASAEVPHRRDRMVDPTFSARLGDLDGDGRADLLVTTTQVDDGVAQSYVDVYLQGDGEDAALRGDPLGFRGTSTALLKLGGFCGSPHLQDVDGDGLDDLAIGTVDPDLLGSLAGGGGAVEADLNLFRNTGRAGPGFARQVAMQHRIVVDDFDGAFFGFVGDANGDGVPDLALRAGGDRLRLRAIVRAGGGYAVGPELAALQLADDARIEPVAGAAGELLVVEARQVLHVRVR